MSARHLSRTRPTGAALRCPEQNSTQVCATRFCKKLTRKAAVKREAHRGTNSINSCNSGVCLLCLDLARPQASSSPGQREALSRRVLQESKRLFVESCCEEAGSSGTQSHQVYQQRFLSVRVFVFPEAAIRYCSAGWDTKDSIATHCSISTCARLQRTPAQCSFITFFVDHQGHLHKITNSLVGVEWWCSYGRIYQSLHIFRTSSEYNVCNTPSYPSSHPHHPHVLRGAPR